jgi:hypothetical protein
MVMRGVLIVTDNLNEFLAQNPEPIAKGTEWKLSDLTDDLKRGGQHRNSLDREQVLDLLANLLASGSPDHAAFKHTH